MVMMWCITYCTLSGIDKLLVVVCRSGNGICIYVSLKLLNIEPG